MESSSCFMSGQLSEKFHFVSETKREPQICIRYIICQHFWFQEDALQMAIICEPCWQIVDQFHCYYENVRQHHGQLLESNSIFIKQEEIEIEGEEIDKEGCQVEEANALGGELNVEVAEECNKLPVEVDQVLEKLNPKKIGRKRGVNSVQKKRLKCTSSDDQEVVEKLTRRKMAQNQKLLWQKKKQEEDSFIQQHLTYGCEHCPVKFEDFISIRRHMVDVHGQTHIMCCGVQYSSRSVLFQHVQAVLNPKAFTCELCDKSYTLDLGYIRHKQRYHPNGEPLKYGCDQCPKRYSTEGQLNRHALCHKKAKEEKPKCEVCGKCFKRKMSLKEHMDSVHEKNAIFVCEICSKPFARRWMFMEHRMTHDYTAEELRKQCPVCKRWQKNLRMWKKHMSRHNSTGSHKCDQCDHVSVNSFALKVHVERRHQKNLKCVCDLCGKVYGHPVTLKEHVANAHTKEPLYSCMFCERKFFSNASMYAHRKKAHPQEWQKHTKARYGNKESEEEKDENST